MDMLSIGITTDTRKKINELVEKIREIIVRFCCIYFIFHRMHKEHSREKQ